MSDALTQGLIDFWSNQSDLIFAQYKNINQLLGPIADEKDWTAPGTLCEVLLRDFLRRHLLPGCSIDKGFVFGRVERDGKESHGPEIDILIHDSAGHVPVYRCENFVIVKAEAVRGMIQVKRSFTSSGKLVEGIKQSIAAKQHLLDVLVQEKIKKRAASKKYPEWTDLQKQFFSGVVSFEGNTKSATYHTHLLNAYNANRPLAYPDCEFNTSVYVLPDFVGSLERLCIFGDSNYLRRSYKAYKSEHGKKMMGLQLLLLVLTGKFRYGGSVGEPILSFPSTMTPTAFFAIPGVDVPVSPDHAPT